MGDYIYTVLCAGIFTGVIVSLSPDTENGKLGKFIAFAGALCMALTLLSPIGNFNTQDSGESFLDTDTEINNQALAEYYANSAGSTLSKAFSIERSKLSARVTFDEEDKNVEKISITYKGEKSFDTDLAEQLLSKIYSLPAEVNIIKTGDGQKGKA